MCIRDRNRSAQQRGIDRFVSFFGRSFYEHGPVESWDKSIRAEDRLSVYVLRHYGFWPEDTRIGLKGRFHLSEFAHILSLQKQTAAGVRNELARTGNDITVTGLS